jgi:hypothetical protein
LFAARRGQAFNEGLRNGGILLVLARETGGRSVPITSLRIPNEALPALAGVIAHAMDAERDFLARERAARAERNGAAPAHETGPAFDGRKREQR